MSTLVRKIKDKINEKKQRRRHNPSRPNRPVSSSAKLNYPHALVIANFEPKHPDELPAKEYEIVALLNRADEDWYFACSLDKQRVGYIAKNFLNVLIDIAPFNVPSSSGSPHVPMRKKNHRVVSLEVPKDFPTVDTDGQFAERPRRLTPYITTRVKKLREPDDIFVLVLETFVPESEDHIGAEMGDIMLCEDPAVKPGQSLPEDWIYCKNLSGRAGAFPGNFAELIDDASEIDRKLQEYPHAVATKASIYPINGYVEIEEGEVFYIERFSEDTLWGRTASGKNGKLALDNCKVIVPP